MPRHKNILPLPPAHTREQRHTQFRPNRFSAAINCFLPNGYTRIRGNPLHCKRERFRERCTRRKQSLSKTIRHKHIALASFAPLFAHKRNSSSAYFLTCRVCAFAPNTRRRFRRAPSCANRFQIRERPADGFASPTISNSARG